MVKIKKFGGTIFRKLNRAKQTNGASFEPIGRVGMSDTLANYLKRHKGMIMDEIKAQMQNLNYDVRNEIGKGIRNP